MVSMCDHLIACQFLMSRAEFVGKHHLIEAATTYADLIWLYAISFAKDKITVQMEI